MQTTRRRRAAVRVDNFDSNELNGRGGEGTEWEGAGGDGTEVIIRLDSGGDLHK